MTWGESHICPDCFHAVHRQCWQQRRGLNPLSRRNLRALGWGCGARAVLLGTWRCACRLQERVANGEGLKLVECWAQPMVKLRNLR